MPQAADGSRIEQPVSVPMPRSTSPAASAAAFPADEPPVVLPGMQRVVHGAVPRVGAEHAPGELGQVAPCPTTTAPASSARCTTVACAVRHVVGVDPRAVRRADAGRVDQVLDEQRAPGERPVGGAAQRLVEPGDRGVVGGSRHAGSTRHALDLDLRARDHERRDLDERRGRPGLAEHLLPHRVDERPVVHVGQVDGHLDDVRERAAAGREHGAHVLEHAARLRDDVVAADELAPLVDGDDAGDEQEAARLDGVREVRDRLGLAGDPELPARRHAQAKCALSASKPPWNTCEAKKSVQCPCWSRSQSNVVHHSTKLPPPSVTGVTRSVAQ